MLRLLENEHRAALRNHETVAGRVERPAGDGRVVGATVRVDGRAQRLHLAEAGEGDRHHHGLRPGAEHQVGLSTNDRLHRLADGVAAGRAGAHDRHVRSSQAVLDGDHPGSGVGDHVWEQERGDAVDATLRQGLDTVADQPDPADPGPDHHPESVTVRL